jgi:hypothetical protein
VLSVVGYLWTSRCSIGLHWFSCDCDVLNRWMVVDNGTLG